MPDNKWVADLKTLLQVAKARLDVREKKKTEQVAKERYAIVDYVRNNKVPRARIAVEHLVREDYKIEAMDRIEAYVDTLLMRMQLIKDRPKNGSVDPAIEQPLSNILWAAPFLSQDIPEFIQMTNMFKKHFGLEYVAMCEQNKLGMVDVDLLRCLSCDHIPKLLIEKYLVEMCGTHNVPFEPDQTVMAQDPFWTLGERYTPHPNMVPEEKRPPPPPPGCSACGGSGGSSGGSGGTAARLDYLPAPSSSHPSAPTYERTPPCYVGPQPQYPSINFGPSIPGSHPAPPSGPRHGYQPDNRAQPPYHDPFPQVPTSAPGGAQGGNDDDPGFDDLARRFHDLKNRK